MFCKNCGAELASDSKFCNKCGTKIDDSERIQKVQKQIKKDEKEVKKLQVEKITFIALFFVCIGFFFYGMTNNLAYMGIMVLFIGFFFAWQFDKINKQQKDLQRRINQ